MARKNLENPIIDAINKRASNERFVIFAAIALIVAGSVAMVLSKTHCKENNIPQKGLELKLCTPEEQRKVRQVLEKGRHATDEEVQTVLRDLKNILDEKLDCGWEPVMNLREKLSSRRQP